MAEQKSARVGPRGGGHLGAASGHCAAAPEPRRRLAAVDPEACPGPGASSAAAARRGVRLVSFGYLHQPAPVADLVLDVRRYLRDPAAARGVLDLDGRARAVQDVVLATPGAAATVQALADFVNSFPRGQDCVVAIGCAGGRHRSVALVEVLVAALTTAGHTVEVVHLDVHRPRVLRAAAGDA